MAVSFDGYTFTAVNDGQPIISGDSISEQHGIRDPHICRSPKDGAFYMAMTDLHIYGREHGLRTTQWERDEKYGWGNNRALVLLARRTSGTGRTPWCASTSSFPRSSETWDVPGHPKPSTTPPRAG